MAQVASLTARLQADISNYETNMKKSISILQNVKKNFNSLSNTFSSIGKKMGDFGNKMEDISKKAERASKSMNNIGKGMSKYVTAPIMAGVGAGLKFNSTMEDAMVNFTTMLGSAEKAQSMVSDLQNMANKTPFGMGDLQNGAQTLLSFGASAESIMPTLKTLGDISLGNKDKFNSLTLAFAQMQSTGKLTGQDLMQMINAGFNPLQEISKKTGKSIGELKDIMSKGGISSDMVTAAFKSATEEGGRFFNGMENASKTFRGRLSTLKDAVMELAGEFAKPIFDVLKDKLASLTEKINNVIEWFKNLDEGTKKHIATFALIVAAVGPVLLIGSKLVGAFSKLPKVLSMVKTGFGGLKKVFSLLAANPIVAIILVIIGVLIYLYNTNEKVRNAIQNAWEGLKSFFSGLAQFFKTFFDYLVQIFKAYVEANIGFLQNAWDSIVVVVTAIFDIFSELFGFLGALLTGDWDAMWEHAKNIIKTAAGAIIVVALNLIDNMLIGFQKLSEILIDKIFVTISKKFQDMINGLIKGWNWLADKFGWKQVGLLQLDIEANTPSKAIKKTREDLQKIADYWRGGKKAELPFSFGKNKNKPEKPKLPKPDMPDFSAFDGLNMTFDNVSETAGKAKDGVDKLADSVKGLVESIRQQTQSFKDSLSLFDTFERKVVSPERLMNRLKAQVKAMKQWTSSLATLSNKGVNETFLNELRAMGPQNVDYIRALAQMSDSQLAQYQQLYGQKYNVAQKEAEKMVTTQQRIDKYVEQEIVLQITGNKISSDDDVDRIAKEIVRKLKMKGV
ncbi:tape measure protein [Paratissierella segnis]|uniref:Tape measure protein n=1 Tax=Paratissierella segnis TaxID=2763679 RepID=A0A926IIM3_9FIRM|nr:tape measure protein [Paratissierella segnis]MBC8587114.1 tape measure protein [Paratissierella segnis]